MGSIVTQRNIGALLSVVTSVEPQSSAAATINGTGIDRQAHSMAGCCVLHQAAGAVGGTPTTTSVVTKLQDSPDNSTFSDYKPDWVNVATNAALTAANTENSLSVDLTAANRYIRAVTTVAFTGGTSPTALVAADVVLSGENTVDAV